ncbi:MAG: hypothetical protein EXR62_05390 [Chloroflexi bacterium]|nr:hypothetical protein [Chloroflexota bacterium]
MSVAENKALVRRYIDAISGKAKTASLQDQYIADSDEVLKQHIANSEVGFPKYEFIPEDMFAEGDRVAVRFTFHAAHQGVFMGIPPTGKQVSVPGIIIYRIADGKIAEHWLQMDAMALMQQIGVQP